MGTGRLSPRDVLVAVLIAIAIAAALYFVYLVRQVIGLMLVSVFLAIALTPVVNQLDRGRFPRWAAILSVYFGIVIAIFGLGLAIVPPVVRGVNEVVHNLPRDDHHLRTNKHFRKYDNNHHVVDKLNME